MKIVMRFPNICRYVVRFLIYHCPPLPTIFSFLYKTRAFCVPNILTETLLRLVFDNTRSWCFKRFLKTFCFYLLFFTNRAKLFFTISKYSGTYIHIHRYFFEKKFSWLFLLMGRFEKKNVQSVFTLFVNFFFLWYRFLLFASVDRINSKAQRTNEK